MSISSGRSSLSVANEVIAVLTWPAIIGVLSENLLLDVADAGEPNFHPDSALSDRPLDAALTALIASWHLSSGDFARTCSVTASLLAKACVNPVTSDGPDLLAVRDGALVVRKAVARGTAGTLARVFPLGSAMVRFVAILSARSSGLGGLVAALVLVLAVVAAAVVDFAVLVDGSRRGGMV